MIIIIIIYVDDLIVLQDNHLYDFDLKKKLK